MAGSWNRVNHFIIEADQMTHPIHWNPMEDKWKAWVNNLALLFATGNLSMDSRTNETSKR